MRWLAASFFFLVAVGCLGMIALIAIDPWPTEDTAGGVILGEGIFFALLCLVAAWGGLWVVRHWPNGSGGN